MEIAIPATPRISNILLPSGVLRLRRAVGEHAAPGVVGSPEAGTEAFELDDLRVVNEQVDVDPVVLDVPGEDVGVGGLEHDVLETEFGGDVRDDVGAPLANLLG